MITQHSQIKINLPVQLKEFVESKARKFGVPLATYVRHLIIKDVEEMEYPVYQASKSTEVAYRRALDAEKKGKLIRVDDIDAYFEKL